MSKVHYKGIPCNTRHYYFRDYCNCYGNIRKIEPTPENNYLSKAYLDSLYKAFSTPDETELEIEVTCKKCKRLLFNQQTKPKCSCGLDKICLLHVGKA